VLVNKRNHIPNLFYILTNEVLSENYQALKNTTVKAVLDSRYLIIEMSNLLSGCVLLAPPIS